MVLKKKGSLALSALVVIILVLFVGGILVLISIGLLRSGSEFAEREICRSSIAAVAAKQKQTLGDLIYPLNDISCFTRYVTITTGQRFSQRTGDNAVEITVSSQEEAMRAVAEEMAGCWWQMGSGDMDKYNFIENDRDTTNMCFACADIFFTDEYIEEFGLTLGSSNNSFHNFLQTAVVKDLQLGKNTTYAAVLPGASRYPDSLSIADSYSVTYAIGHKSYWVESLAGQSALVAGGGTLGAGAVVGGTAAAGGAAVGLATGAGALAGAKAAAIGILSFVPGPGWLVAGALLVGGAALAYHSETADNEALANLQVGPTQEILSSCQRLY